MSLDDAISVGRDRDGLITPQSDPKHWVVGRLWVGWNGQIYYCDSYDPSLGYWMTNIWDEADRRNISERAPTNTYHEIRGQWTRGEIEVGPRFLAVDLLKAPYESHPIPYKEATVAPVHVAIFSDEWHAKRVASTAEKAAMAHMNQDTSA